MKRLFIYGLILLIGACSKVELNPLSADARILAFGDSLTEGKGVDKANSYPAQLSSLIARKVVNAGISGETSAEGLARIERVLDDTQPDLVILIEGGNDILRNYDLQETEANLAAMIEIIQARKIELILIGVPLKSLFSSSCASFYQTLAEKYSLALDCDSIGELLRASKYKSDSVHFNKQGYAMMAKRIEALLKDSGALP